MQREKIVERKNYIQILSVLSSFAVVVLHTNDCFWSFSYKRYWITANALECIFYFAVPIFFMISGATLINYRDRYSTIDFFKKRVTKTVIPYVVWILLAIVWFIYSGKYTVSEVLSLRFIMSDILNHNSLSIYWFFIPLFAVYLSIPVLSSIPKDSRKKIFGYTIGVAFISNSLLPLICGIFNISYDVAIKLPVASGYILYVLIGYYVDNYEVTKRNRIIIYILGICGLIVHFFGTLKLSYAAGYIVSTYKGYLNVPCVLYSAAIFLFFKNMKGERQEILVDLLSKITKPFVGVTFGIYLIHWYVIQIILGYTGISRLSIWWRTIGSIAVFLISAIVIKIMHKIPLLRRIVPS